MKFEIITIFPDVLKPYINESILRRAQEEKLVEINVHDLRDFTQDKHRTVDDTPYGGGPGMVMRADVIVRAVSKIKKENSRVILFSPAGKKFTQEDAKRYRDGYSQLVMICGRYEGVDERVAYYIADEIVSIGDYVLAGGEIPALVVTEAVSRLVPGVLGDSESEESMRFGVGVPQYAKPDIVVIDGKEYRVPEVLKSGNHAEIEKWRKKKKVG